MELRPGAKAWLVLAGFVAATDTYLIHRAKEARERGQDEDHWATMSVVFGDAATHPIKRWPVITIWLILTLHLFAVLVPEPLRSWMKRADPIGALARLLSR